MDAFDPYFRLGRPAEAHNVRTPEEYRAYQARVIAHNRAHLPQRRWRDPFVADVAVQPFVNAGRWVVSCPACANAPLYDPEWQLACCCECGAIFEEVEPPAEWRAIETLLMARPLGNRHWMPGEPLAELARDNQAHGLAPDGGA